MPSYTRSFKQTGGYFVPLGSCQNKVLAYSGSAGAGGSSLPGNFTIPAWSATATASGTVSTLLNAPTANNTLLKDMGKTVVSANRTFRKVQLVLPNLSTAGVSSDVSNVSNYYTGYIELAGPNAFENGVSQAVPVAYLPALLL